MDYHRLNQKLAKKPYILPRIGETMHKLEGFQYEISLYLNMGYYTIRFTSAIQYMTTFVTEFGKFRYNRPPMSMCASGDIIKSKSDDLLGDTKGVKMHIDDILVLIKECFEKHIG